MHTPTLIRSKTLLQLCVQGNLGLLSQIDNVLRQPVIEIIAAPIQTEEDRKRERRQVMQIDETEDESL